MNEKESKEEICKLRLTIKDLVEVGAHFGHRTDRWNPKMRPYIFEERQGLHIIDLPRTMFELRRAREAVDEVIRKGKSILFVGTKKQAKGVVRTAAEECNQHYVSEHWLGGTLTNLNTIRNSIKKLEQIEKQVSTGGTGLTKKELTKLTKLQMKLERNFSGIRGMHRLPGLVFIVDPHKEYIALREAYKLGIPIIAICDTNCDPDHIDYVIPANDDSLKSIHLIVEELVDAIKKRQSTLSSKEAMRGQEALAAKAPAAEMKAKQEEDA